MLGISADVCIIRLNNFNGVWIGHSSYLSKLFSWLIWLNANGTKNKIGGNGYFFICSQCYFYLLSLLDLSSLYYVYSSSSAAKWSNAFKCIYVGWFFLIWNFWNIHENWAALEVRWWNNTYTVLIMTRLSKNIKSPN